MGARYIINFGRHFAWLKYFTYHLSYMPSNGRVVNDEVGIMWKEAVVS
jgi:hypothetical protein